MLNPQRMWRLSSSSSSATCFTSRYVGRGSSRVRSAEERMMDAAMFGAWVATGLTLFIFSFLYRDNPLFKLAEHLYVGVSVGYTIVKAYDTVIVHLIVKPIVEQGEIALLIPVAIGLLMLTRY